MFSTSRRVIASGSAAVSRPTRSTTWTRSSTTWTRRATTAVAATLTGLVALSPASALAATPASGPVQTYVVRAQHGQLSALDHDLRRSGTVLRQIGLIDADVVRLRTSLVPALRRDARVASVTRDASVSLQSAGGTRERVSETMADVADDIGATDMWARGYTGAGIDVALIDSGVAPVPGLTGAKVVHGPDLSFESQDADTAHIDRFGHGTHLAGIIAGSNDATGFSGMAPGARIVSVKVADGRGNADVSQVIAGIDWVVQHAHSDGLRIRVLNLAFGTDSEQAYQLDPLAYAAEQAWHAGIVVVVSAGNGGGHGAGLTDPAIDPYVLAVGAADTSKRLPAVAAFSSRGDGDRNPDALAPGAHLASLGVPGSTIDVRYGSTARTSDGLFRGSGTSQAAAVTAGAAALLLDARPGLSPDEVKGLLTGTAAPIAHARARAQGHGMIDVAAAALAAAPTQGQDFARSVGTGALEGSRGSGHLKRGDELLTGERDVFGKPVDTAGWARLTAGHRAWSGGTFNSTAWAGTCFGANAWGSTSWSSTSWSSTSWSSTAWSSTSWSSTAWSSTAWSSTAWSSTAWSSTSWV